MATQSAKKKTTTTSAKTAKKPARKTATASRTAKAPAPKIDVVKIFDTTLRDGEQSPGATMTVNEKLKIAKHLAWMGVDAIEAGFPITSEGDFEAVKLIAQKVKGPEIVGLARTLPGDIDRAWEAIKYSSNPRIHTFIATSDIHLKYKLRKTRAEVMKLAVDGVKRAKKLTDNVEFSAEDSTRSDPKFLCEVVEAAIAAGAVTVNIPDTVGYTVPMEYAKLMDTLQKRVKNINRAVISVHCHNDLGLAVANSLMAIIHGARQVECTINGLGERAGNCSLEEIVMALFTRHNHFGVGTNINSKGISKASKMVSSITGIDVQPNKAIVGRNAFAHEAGIHQDGVLKERLTYEIMDAKTIGLASSELVLGKHSGRHAFQNKLKDLGMALSKDDTERAFLRFKAVADKKKTVHDADIESIIEDEIIKIPATYNLEYCHVMCGGSTRATATIALKIFGEFHEAASLGVGPIDAVYKCIGEITQVYNQLEDFSVKSVTEGLDALGEVTVKISDRDGKIYTGRGSALDILESSAKAYVQALNKLVYWRRTHGKQVMGTGLGMAIDEA